MGNLHVVQFLLRHGASVHVRDQRGDSPLIDAVLAKSMPVIHLLVQAGAILPWSNVRIAVSLCRYNADEKDKLRSWFNGSFGQSSFENVCYLL